MKPAAFTAALLASLGLTAAASSAPSQPEPVFSNVNLVHIISLDKNYAKESINVLVENIGNRSQDRYYVPFTADQSSRLGGFEARYRKDATAKPFEVKVLDLVPGSGLIYYELHLPEPIEPGARQTLGISFYYLKAYTPQPSSIEQTDDQFLRYDFSAYCPSAYPVLKQKTEVKCPSSRISDFTKIPGAGDVAEYPVKQGVKLTYGPFDEQPAGASLPLSARFEFTRPVIHASQLERDVEVSHWGGNVAFEERHILHNRGANLSTLFNRARWSQDRYSNTKTYALQALDFPLKAGSADAYFTDTIGNISTSHFRTNSRDALLTIKPRYPVFGGWRFPFTVGWNSDAKHYLRRSPSGSYVLNVPFLGGPKQSEGIEYEQISVQVILPEGARNVRFHIDIPTLAIVDTSISQHKTFLDTRGRTTLTIHARNLVDEFRDRTLIVAYDYSLSAHLRKPIIVFLSMLCVFVSAWAIGGLDLSFVRNGPRPVVAVLSTPQTKLLL